MTADTPDPSAPVADQATPVIDAAQALEALRATLDALTSHIAVLDERGVILITNQAWRDFAIENGLPWPRVGEGVNYLAVCDGASGLSSDEASAAANAIRDVVAQPWRTFSFEYPCHSPTQNRWFLVRVTGFVTHGAPRVVVSHQDITSRKVAEAARATAQRMFEGLFEYAPDAMVMVKGDGLVGLVNRQAELLFGYDRQELLEGSIEALLPGLALAGHVVKRRRFLEAGVPRMVGADVPALRGRKRNGAEFPVEISLSTLDGEGVVAAIRDITDRVRVEEQLRAAQRLETVGRLAGGIAHDFNNILSVIKATADLARLAVPDVPEGQQLREDLDAICEAGERAAALTQQLLAFSRRQALQPVEVDIESAVRTIEPMLQRLAGIHVSLVVSVVEPTMRVLVDPTQLEQVILNLAANACDAMPHGGILTIQLARASVERSSPGVSDGIQPEHYACLAVTDTGTGMDESTRRRVFEPFFTTKGLGHGVGLGLATVFGIVKQCGGEILCESEQGQGTTFRVYLPLTDTAIPESVASAEASTTSGTETIRHRGPARASPPPGHR